MPKLAELGFAQYGNVAVVANYLLAAASHLVAARL